MRDEKVMVATNQPTGAAGSRQKQKTAQEGESWRNLGTLNQAGLYVILALLSVLMFFPFVWMVSTALRPSGYETIQTLIPQPYLAFENFGKAWNYRGTFFFQWTINSVVISVVATFMALVLNALSGFAFAKYTFPGRDLLFMCVLATMMVPFQVIMIPVYVVISYLGMANTYSGVILPSTASAFGIFLMRQFMQSIPDELLDAARIDGSSELRIFAQIIMPLSMPAVAVFAILHFLHMWNDYLLPLLVMSRRQMFTLQIGIVNFQGEYRAEWNLMMSMVLLSIVPTILLFLFFQRYFVQGIAMTGMKG